MINSGYIVKVYCLNPTKNAASATIAANMNHESWMNVTGMFTSDENVPIAEFECATFKVTAANIRAARLKHNMYVHKCDHDN